MAVCHSLEDVAMLPSHVLVLIRSLPGADTGALEAGRKYSVLVLVRWWVPPMTLTKKGPGALQVYDRVKKLITV